MPKKSLTDLRSMLDAEKNDALAAVRSSKLSAERTHAMDYYNGDMSRDMPAQDGRSRAVSSDVSDTVEGLMPSLMEIFAGSDDVVRFEPAGPQDVEAADQETDYVNHVFMQKNPGFLVLYQFIKDALLSKVGIVKVYWREDEEERRETYLDQSEDAFMMLVANPAIKIVEHSTHPVPAQIGIAPVPGANGMQQLTPPASGGGAQGPAAVSSPVAGSMLPNQAQSGMNAMAPQQGQTGMGQMPMLQQGMAASNGQFPQGNAVNAHSPTVLHDVTVVTVKKTACARVEGVPPEEFGISRFARNIKDCGYCFHEVIKREEDLIADGYDRDEIRALPTYSMLTNPEELARDTVDEHLSGGGDEGINEVNRQIKITEHYVRMDYEGNGKVQLYRVTTGGDQGKVLTRDGQPEILQTDFVPFAAITPVIVTHRFFGRSIADLVMDIQRIKTALLRGILDNAYLAVNPRAEVSEAHATENTLDDLLVSRPGGIVRTKMPGGINWQVVPSIAAEIFPVVQYMDDTREWRSGVNKQQQGLDAGALQNQTATLSNQIYNASQAKMKLIARIFAETGIKDLFWLLHATIRKNGGPDTFWVRHSNRPPVTVDPREWQDRDALSVNVGLGSGGKTEQMQQLMGVINLQKDALAGGLTNLVTPANLYKSACEFAKLAGRKDYPDFFTDPSTQPAPQAPPDPKLIQIQNQKELAQQKAQFDQQHLMTKAQADMAEQNNKFQLEMRQTLFENHMAHQEHVQTLTQNYQEHMMSMKEMATKAEAANTPKAAVEVKHNSKDIAGPIADTVAQLGQHLAAHSTAQTQAILGAIQHLAAPKRIVRGPDGKVSHVESMVN